MQIEWENSISNFWREDKDHQTHLSEKGDWLLTQGLRISNVAVQYLPVVPREEEKQQNYISASPKWC